jgi:hypothetical protein
MGARGDDAVPVSLGIKTPVIREIISCDMQKITTQITKSKNGGKERFLWLAATSIGVFVSSF